MHDAGRSGTPIWQPLPRHLTTPPQRRRDIFERPRLVRRVEELLIDHRYLVLNAPSGYGKTVSVAEWAQHTDGIVAWLSVTHKIDTGDDLLRGVVSSILHVLPDRDDLRYAGIRAGSDGGPGGYLTFAELLQSIEGQVTVVIDDAQRATSAIEDPVVKSMFASLPRSSRIILLGRDMTSDVISRLILHREAAVIGASELAFDLTETEEAIALGTASGPAAEILAATGGWPLAVRLSAGPMGGSRATDLRPSHRLLTHYVADEILAPLPADLRDFILATTAAPRFTVALAGALSGRSDPEAALDQCLRHGLFLSSYASESGQLYSWHELFADHCQRILRLEDAQRSRVLALTAADHLAATEPLIATGLAVRAGEARRGAQILLNNWIGLILEGQTIDLDQALAALPESELDTEQQHALLPVRASCRMMRGDRLTAETMLAAATTSEPGTPAELTHALAVLLLVDAQDEIVRALTVIEQAIEIPEPQLNTAGAVVRACCIFLAGWTRARLRYDTRTAAHLLESAIYRCREAGLPRAAQRALHAHAMALSFLGRFTEALRALEGRGLTDAPDEWDVYDREVDYFSRGWVHFWRSELDEAVAMFAAGSGDPRSMDGYAPLNRIFRAYSAAVAGDSLAVSESEPGLHSVVAEIAHGVPWAIYKRLAETRVSEMRNRPCDLAELTADIESAVNVPVTLALYAGILRRYGEDALAWRVLHRLDLATAPLYVRVHALVTRACLHWSAGRRDDAHANLEEALRDAEQEDIIVAFTDNHDRAAAELFVAHLAETTHSAFLARCLASRDRLRPRRQPRSGTKPLTRREREILEYLRSPMTMKEISAALYISTNTLKTHCRALYRKLGVSGRRDAVRIAAHGGAYPTSGRTRPAR